MSFDDMMLELKRDYIKSMPAKLESIHKALASSNVTLLREEFHKLKGTGKTYGIPEISELCAVIEQLCVKNTAHTLGDVKTALQILSEIHKTRANEKEFNVNKDSRFVEIQKHLQSAGG